MLLLRRQGIYLNIPELGPPSSNLDSTILNNTFNISTRLQGFGFLGVRKREEI